MGRINISIFFATVILCFGVSSCKRKILGCMDQEASNFKPSAELSDGSCRYTPLILDPSFEFDHWSTLTGTGFSPYAYQSNVSDGFMPTNGSNYWKCIPFVNNMFG